MFSADDFCVGVFTQTHLQLGNKGFPPISGEVASVSAPVCYCGLVRLKFDFNNSLSNSVMFSCRPSATIIRNLRFDFHQNNYIGNKQILNQ